jgi:hypothetical protein
MGIVVKPSAAMAANWMRLNRRIRRALCELAVLKGRIPLFFGTAGYNRPSSGREQLKPAQAEKFASGARRELSNACALTSHAGIRQVPASVCFDRGDGRCAPLRRGVSRSTRANAGHPNQSCSSAAGKEKQSQACLLAVADSRTHAAFLATQLATPFSSLLHAHSADSVSLTHLLEKVPSRLTTGGYAR